MNKKKVKGLHSSQHIKGYKTSALAMIEKSDCVVRSIASAFDIEYDEAHKICEVEFKRQRGKGTFAVSHTFGRLKKEGFRIGGKPFTAVSNSVIERIKTVGEFLELYPIGRYILLVRGHAFSVVDGVVVGNIEDSRKLRCRLEGAIRVLSKNTPDVVQQNED